MTDNFQCFNSQENDDMVLFAQCKNKKLKKKKKKIKKKRKSLYIVNGKEKIYGSRTMEEYRVLRKTKRDPITQEKLFPEQAFEINYIWDPYTGERMGIDPYGPIYIDPDNLIHYFYTIRLRKLWMTPSDENVGYYQGTYDDALGIGDDFFLKGRGSFPEWYIFRLPITDCYLDKDHMRQLVTLGPKLTFNDIKEIDRIAQQNENSYYKKFKKNRPSLVRIWHLYHMAIKLPSNENNEDNLKSNRRSVASLIGL